MDYYVFRNIRYADSPGHYRFLKPRGPRIFTGPVLDGTPDIICPQATPLWSRPVGYLPGAQQSEDCLMLNIFVTGDVFDASVANGTHEAPVIAWFHDGE